MTRLEQENARFAEGVIAWAWERARMRWVSGLRDGTELRAVHDGARGGRGRWYAQILFPYDEVWRSLDGFKTPDEAQCAALNEWQRRNPGVVVEGL
jgi:hypothetical protein